MKKIYKYSIYLIIIFLICLTKTYAVCTDEEISAFTRIEENYTVKYEFDKTTKLYNMYFKATEPELYYYKLFVDGELSCEKIDDETLKCYGFNHGIYNIWIEGQTQTCNDTLKEIEIKLPKYNINSDDPICKGIEEFVLCNPAYEGEIDYESFVSRVNSYKKSQLANKDKKEEQEDKQNTQIMKFFNNIWEFIKTNWITVTIVLVFVVLVIITTVITVKSIRESRRLE